MLMMKGRTTVVVYCPFEECQQIRDVPLCYVWVVSRKGKRKDLRPETCQSYSFFSWALLKIGKDGVYSWPNIGSRGRRRLREKEMLSRTKGLICNAPKEGSCFKCSKTFCD